MHWSFWMWHLRHARVSATATDIPAENAIPAVAAKIEILRNFFMMTPVKRTFPCAITVLPFERMCQGSGCNKGFKNRVRLK
jgi:hypothetical protein